MSDKPSQKDDLEVMFSAARRHPPQPSQQLISRVMQDAVAAQTDNRPSFRWLRWTVLQKQAWSIFAGLAVAGFAGLFIGLMMPDLFGWTGFSQFDSTSYQISYGFSSGLDVFWEDV